MLASGGEKIGTSFVPVFGSVHSPVRANAPNGTSSSAPPTIRDRSASFKIMFDSMRRKFMRRASLRQGSAFGSFRRGSLAELNLPIHHDPGGLGRRQNFAVRRQQCAACKDLA